MSDTADPDEARRVDAGGGIAASAESATGWSRLALLCGLLAVLGIWRLPLLVVVLSIFLMIFLHELGHYLTARWSGMKVTEFFLGFGPRLWSVRRGETSYGVKAIVAGGYVKIPGMHNLEEVPTADEHRTYRRQSYPRRLSVAVAGSTMHFLLALALIFSFLLLAGRSEALPPEEWQISNFPEDSAAAAAGLQPGDRIVAVNGQPVTVFSDLIDVLPGPGSEVGLVVQRDDRQLAFGLVLGSHPLDPSRGYLGIQTQRSVRTVNVGIFEAASDTFTEFGDLVVESVRSIGRVFSPGGLDNFTGRLLEGPEEQQVVNQGATDEASGLRLTASDNSSSNSNRDEDRVVSIFGVARLGADITEDGYQNLLVFLAVINVFVGVFNLVPLLPFDGGHVAIATYERFRSRRGRRYYADVTKMLPVSYAVVLLLLFVGLGALYLDVTDPIQLPG